MNRKAILLKVAEYMAEKGKFMSQDEYKRASDKPYNFVALRRLWASWSRLEGLIQANHPDLWEKMNSPVAPKVEEPHVDGVKLGTPKPVATKKAPAKKEK